MIKKSMSRRIFEFCNVCLMIALVMATLFPVWYVFVASFSDSDELVRLGGRMIFWPKGFNIDAYKKAFSNPNILIGYKNTMFIVVAGIICSMLFSIIGAYFLSRRNVMFKKPITIMIMFTMWFSGGLIPFYIAVRDVQLTNSLWSLIIPTLISTYNMIIIRTGFDAIPASLEESAVIDGAGHMIIMFKIMIPLAKASIAVVALYYGVGYWNSWFNASIFLQGSTEKWPLQLILRQILIVNDTSNMQQSVSEADREKIGEAIKYAVIVIATVPILCVYPFIQKYFVKGVMIGAVKG